MIPRWEWRGWVEEYGVLASVLGPRPPDRVQESDEVYLISTAGTDAVKLRAEVMDVKELLAVDEEGLEQWAPVLKAGFPLSAHDVETLAAALKADFAPSESTHSFRTLIDEVVGPNPDLLAVDVHKRRERYTIGGCLAELTEVRTSQGSTHTVAIESEDAAKVVAALREAGVSRRPNVSFARGLKSLLRFGTERYAVIDVGTNSVKFHLGERGADGAWSKVVDRAEVTRLGEGLHESGRLGAEPMERTVAAIAGMVEEAVRRGAAAISAVGTAGLRIAPNSADFLDAVRARCDLTVEVISGEEESRLAFLGATAGIELAGRSKVALDTGGGSSQFTFGVGDEVVERFSVDVGAVRCTEDHGLDQAISESDLSATLDAIAADLARLDGRAVPDAILAMGGAVTNLAAVKHGLAQYDPDVVQGTVLDLTEIDRQIELYRTKTGEDRRAIVGLQPQRADIILAGACIVRTVLDKLGQDAVTVSDRGLRHGVLVERFG